eukprot:m.308750 g.308750  ORF g.308750 m.308750 type:complete len:542 (+) comp44676_c0_seq1:240-1865(+)
MDRRLLDQPGSKQSLRETVRMKLEEALKSGHNQTGLLFPATGDSLELEIYNKAKTTDDYINTVQKVLQRLNTMKRGGPPPPQPQQQPPQPQSILAPKLPQSVHPAHLSTMYVPSASVPANPRYVTTQPTSAAQLRLAPHIEIPDRPSPAPVRLIHQNPLPPPQNVVGISTVGGTAAIRRTLPADPTLQSLPSVTMGGMLSMPSVPMTTVMSSGSPIGIGMLSQPRQFSPQMAKAPPSFLQSKIQLAAPVAQVPIEPPSTLAGNLVSTKIEPSPSASDDVAYAEKRSQLQKYVNPVKRVINKSERTGGSEKELTKLKSLLDILTNPEKKTSLDVLKTCELVLRELFGSLKEDPPPEPPPPNVMTMLLRVMADEKQSGRGQRNTFQAIHQDFGSAVATLNGPVKRPMYGDEPFADNRLPKRGKIEEDEDNAMVLEGELSRLRTKYDVKVLPEGKGHISHTALQCTLSNRSLSQKQVIVVEIPQGYPTFSPFIPFPQQVASENAVDPLKVHKNLIVKLIRFQYYSLTELLSAWESTVLALQGAN